MRVLVMSDIGYCGVIISDFIEYLNMRYYNEKDPLVKSHLGFSMILLKDLIRIIEVKEELPLDAYSDLRFIKFYRNQEENEKFIVDVLKGDGDGE